MFSCRNPHSPRQVPALVEQARHGIHKIKRLEMGLDLIQPILSILMRVQTSIHGRPTPRARSSRRERQVESHTFGCKLVEAGGLGASATVGADELAQVVGDDEENVLVLCHGDDRRSNSRRLHQLFDLD